MSELPEKRGMCPYNRDCKDNQTDPLKCGFVKKYICPDNYEGSSDHNYGTEIFPSYR